MADVQSSEVASPPEWHRPFTDLSTWLKLRVVGQDAAIDNILIALLADGHVLLEGAPGLAKTRLARLLAQALEGDYRRIQFTPDLLPGDLIGTPIYQPDDHRFVFQKGPVFANYILADEINRAPAKVQSALLEAMEERQVTAGEDSYALETPFFVVATQNPIEHDGTWDLPQAQLDRFVMQINLGYPQAAVERDILDLVLGETGAMLSDEGLDDPPPVISKRELHGAKQAVSDVHLSEIVRRYLVRLIAGTRDDPRPLDGVGEHLSHPVSPRGTVMLARTAQGRAWMHGRDHVLPEDVAAVAPVVLRHRIGLTYRAEADGVAPDAIVTALIEQVNVV